MKKNKNQKGITLVALIITTIVLLILAVVAISAVQEEGIIGKAKYARDEYKRAQDKQNSILQGYLSQIEENIPGNSIGNTTGGNSGGNSNTVVEYLGKYVKYDTNRDGSVEDETILWRVLRNDADKVELITADALGNVALDATSFDSARISYNNAISEMVQECERITGITGVRNIGGPITDTTETVDFTGLNSFRPTVSDENFAQYEGENGFKVGYDFSYWQEDYNQMEKAGVAKADNSLEYWVASRLMQEFFYCINFGVESIDANGYYDGGISFFEVWQDGVVNLVENNLGITTYSRAVRPVLTLSSGILEGKTGAGTKTQPIEIY